MRLVAEPITAEAFAPFGSLVGCDRDDVMATSANLGSAERRDFLLDVESRRPGARLNVATFRCRAWALSPEGSGEGATTSTRALTLGMLEKHPMSTQVFIPMTPAKYLVVVAQGDDAPDLSTVRVFVVEGPRGVGYAPGVWHHPMIALERDIDFTCLVWEDGTPLDCVVCPLATPLSVSLSSAPLT